MKVFTLILAGGEGSRLSILGEKRAKPAGNIGNLLTPITDSE